MDPRFDTGFKSLFASKGALKDFLDSVLQLRDNDRIKRLEYSFDALLRFMVPEEKKIILDAFATTGSKRFLNIEMQKGRHSFFVDRTILNKAFLVIKGKKEMENSEEFNVLSKKQKEYRRYEIPETISIWICDFDLPGVKGKYIDEWAIYSKESLKDGKIRPISRKNKYIMISLTNFNKTIDEVKTACDMWIYILRHAGDGKELPDFGNPVIAEALKNIRIENADDATLAAMEKDMVTQEEKDCMLASVEIEAKMKAIKPLIDAGILTVEKAAEVYGIPEEEILFWIA